MPVVRNTLTGVVCGVPDSMANGFLKKLRADGKPLFVLATPEEIARNAERPLEESNVAPAPEPVAEAAVRAEAAKDEPQEDSTEAQEEAPDKPARKTAARKRTSRKTTLMRT